MNIKKKSSPAANRGAKKNSTMALMGKSLHDPRSRSIPCLSGQLAQVASATREGVS